MDAAHLRAARHEALDASASRCPERLKPLMSQGLRARLAAERSPTRSSAPRPRAACRPRGADMAKFMIAHLQNGAFGPSADPAARAPREQMHGTALTMLPRVHRMLLGFYETELQRPSHHRSRRRHAVVPQRSASVHRRRRRLVHFHEQRRQGRRDRRHSHHAVRAIRRPLFAGPGAGRQASMRRPRPSTRA